MNERLEPVSIDFALKRPYPFYDSFQYGIRFLQVQSCSSNVLRGERHRFIQFTAIGGRRMMLA